ncbi:MAG TPA: GNAT family N-acetyltransferase [Ilumatobacteraceae bacterium]
MIIRDATPDDVAACNAVWISTQTDVQPGPLADQPLSMHEITTGRLVVAEVDGDVVGFGGTLLRSGVLYLADLFVVPAHQGRGVGRGLAEELCARHVGPSFTFASSDPRAQALYARLGMLAFEHYHYVNAPADLLKPWPTDVELSVAPRSDVLSLDAAITGRDRAVDIDYASANGAVWYLARRRGRVVGALAVAPMWWSPWHPQGARLGPVLVESADDMSATIAAGVVAARDSAVGVDIVSMFAAASLVALPQLLDAGFDIVDTDLFMTSDPRLLDPSRYMPTVDTP